MVGTFGNRYLPKSCQIRNLFFCGLLWPIFLTLYPLVCRGRKTTYNGLGRVLWWTIYFAGQDVCLRHAMVRCNTDYLPNCWVDFAMERVWLLRVNCCGLRYYLNTNQCSKYWDMLSTEHHGKAHILLREVGNMSAFDTMVVPYIDCMH